MYREESTSSRKANHIVLPFRETDHTAALRRYVVYRLCVDERCELLGHATVSGPFPSFLLVFRPLFGRIVRPMPGTHAGRGVVHDLRAFSRAC